MLTDDMAKHRADSRHQQRDSTPEARVRTHHGHGHGHGHDHAHDHAHGHDSHGSKILASAFLLTATFMLVELIGGLMAGSLALVADAGHMFADAAALAFAWAASRIAARPPDAKRSFGYQRSRVLATFVNGCALLFIVAWIALEAVQRVFQPHSVDARTVIWIGTLGFIVNLIVFALLQRGDKHDMNIAAATLHVMGDLLGSLAAVISAVIIIFTGWTVADPISSLLVCGLIVRSAWSLVQRSAHILMEGVPEGLDLDELREFLERRVPAIRDVHHVHCWLAGPHETLMTLHATIRPGANHMYVLHEIKSALEEHYGITHATIQIEEEPCADVTCRDERAMGDG